MNYSKFKTWICNQDLHVQTTADEAKTYMASCDSCKTLYRLDKQLEAHISESLDEVQPPPGLFSMIKDNMQPEVSARTRNYHIFPWIRLAASLATAAVILFVFFNPFSGPIKSFDQIGTFALAEHLSSDLEMTFKAQEVSDAAGWFSERVGFGIVIPALKNQGFQFLDCRECLIGKKKAAYLYYDSQGEKVSLFIVNYRDLDFPLSQHRTYPVYDQGHEIKVWKQGTLCYGLVESAGVIP